MKRKGFTLIELLAVIVILSVIALIATPMIMNVIDTSRKKASIESVNGILDAAEKYQLTSMLEGENIRRFEFPNEKLQYKGTKPESGTLVIDEEGNTSITVKINGYCIRKRFNENTPSIIEKENCTIEDSELIYAERYKEEILNGADPEIKENLIPVTIKSDGTVTYADIKKEWYSYENKIWANAVILKDEYDYLNSKNKIFGCTKEKDYVVLDGIDDYINLDLENYNFGSTFTESIKFKINSFQKGYMNIIGNQEASGTSLAIYEDKKIYAGIYHNNKYDTIVSEKELETETWYIVTLVQDNDNMYLYLNGELLNSTNVLNVDIKSSAMPFTIGTNPGPSENIEYSNISVKKAAIFDRALTSSEIKKYYSSDIVINDNTKLLSFVDFEKNYNVGEEIPESDIKQYYVWIPRYRYELWNVEGENKYPNGTSSESAINIVFESKKTTPSKGSKNGEWLTHPAFTSFDTNGIWVGKYETSYDEETYTDSSKFLTTNPNYASATQASNIIIKPNVRNLTNKNVSEFYTLGRGINESLNSHMMKNSEWGAVAYLTYSLYGKCTEEGCEEVYLNNINTGYLNSTAKFSGQWQNGATITGCSASSTSASVSSNQSSCASGYAYNEANNKASTTGNISGIYDMSGGNWEYVMGVIKDASGKPVSGYNSTYNSGFNGTYGTESGSKTNGIAFPTDTRYYDLYTANSTALEDGTWWIYSNGQLGDGTIEIAVSKSNSSSGDRGLWYSDYAHFPAMTNPWFNRGGYFSNGSGAGFLNFRRLYGNAYTNNAFRVVLAY